MSCSVLALQDMELQSECARRRLRVSRQGLGLGLAGLTSTAIMVALGTSSCSSSSRLALTHVYEVIPVRLPPGGSGWRQDQLDRVSPDVKTIGIVVVAALAACAGSIARRGDNGYATTHEIGRQRRQAIVLAFRPAVFDRHVRPSK